MGTAVLATPDSTNRLVELGLDEPLLVEAARRGLWAWARCTPNHPQNFPGTAAWAETICALRELLVPHGWTRDDDGGLPLVVNPAGTMALTATTGDEGTGQPDDPVCTKYSKGPKTVALVAVNHVQAELFPHDAYLPANRDEPTGRTTWYLLYRRDTASRELLCELACPLSIGEDGRITAWSERIILTATPFDDDAVVLPVHDGPSVPDVDVEIKRRV